MEHFKKVPSERFLKLMLIDGCFTLEIFRPAIETLGDYHSDDLIFGNHGKLYIWPFIRQDMLLLENQLPMLVLDKLLAINYKMVRSANQLYDAGVIIKTSENSHFNYDHHNISFEGGVLRLPIFIIDENTESTFLNMIAFERCHVGAGSDMTTFVRFMSNLIHSAGDINVQGSQGVIRITFGSVQDAADLFDTTSKNLTLDASNRLARILDDVNCIQRSAILPRQQEAENSVLSHVPY
ncbi:unnamed protein product [Ilex paraguariensis]|uniref:Uncharacterized protein n=1 Tax=Ilex paraguariensis TaxID=185542 RepID=A0ABC8RUJ3_9AQUA